MSTFLFDKIIFGPVKSRRLGVSLGINLLPLNRKICNFNCIYCECGWTDNNENDKDKLPYKLPSRTEVSDALDKKLSEMKLNGDVPDVITFAGNGEPTLHPAFSGIIDDSIQLRNKYFPAAKIAVLSNATTIGNRLVRESLMKVDQNILKLDSAIDQTINIHNQPRVKTSAAEIIGNLGFFKGNLIIQTLFLRGLCDGRIIDNTTEAELDALLKVFDKIRPAEVMIYTISRDTPSDTQLKKVPLEELDCIAALIEKLGIKTQVSG